MINAVGSYGSVCLSKLNRLKAILTDYRQSFSNDLEAEIEVVSFLEHTHQRLSSLKNLLSLKRNDKSISKLNDKSSNDLSRQHHPSQTLNLKNLYLNTKQQSPAEAPSPSQ